MASYNFSNPSNLPSDTNNSALISAASNQSDFLTDMNILFDNFFNFKDQQPPTTGIPQDKITGAKTLAGYLVSQTDKNDTKTVGERASTAAAVATNKDSSVASYLLLINELKLLYKSNPGFKTLVDFYVKQEKFNRIRKSFFSLVNSQCENTKTITDAKTLQTYIDDYLIPDISDQSSSFTEKYSPLVDFMNSLLKCMTSVLNTTTPPATNTNTNTNASDGPPSGAIVMAQEYQRMRQTILKLNPNFYLELKTFIYKYLALFLCHIIVTFTNLTDTTVTEIPPKSWGFILPYIVTETTKQGLNPQEKTLLQTFVNNNSMSEIISLSQYPDDQYVNKIQLVNMTIDSIVSIIDAKIATINNITRSTGLSLMKTRVLNECNALRLSLEYNKVKSIYKSNEDVVNNLADIFIYFASYYSKEVYKVGRNESYYPKYIGSVLKSIQNNNTQPIDSIPNRETYNYIENITWFCEHYQDGNFNDQIQLFFDTDAEKYKSVNSNSKARITPTTLTIVTIDSRGGKKYTCLPGDMYPPDQGFNPIAKIMKQKAIEMNFQAEAKALYDQILADRRECKSTVKILYSKTLSSMTATKWESLGGRKTRRRMRQKNANKRTQKRRKFRTRKQKK
jgi:hypothetical protein